MFEIEITSINRMYQIAKDADLSESAVLLISEYEIDQDRIRNCRGISVLHFRDIANIGEESAITDCMADKIRDFVFSLSSNLDTLFICCDSGESRSPAVAAAICRYYGFDEMKIWRNPHYHPNPLVYTTVCRSFGVRITDETVDGLLQINENEFRRAIEKKRTNVFIVE